MEKNDKKYIRWITIVSTTLTIILVLLLLSLGFCLGLLILKLAGYAI